MPVRKLRSIPPVTALGSRTRNPDRGSHMIRGGFGIGSGHSRVSNVTKHDRWTVEEYTPTTSTAIKKTPKTITRPKQNPTVDIEMHDIGNYHLIVSIGKPERLEIENIIRSLTHRVDAIRETVNNGIWLYKVEKDSSSLE